MEEILTKKSTSLSAFKANPNKEVRSAGDQPFCVLTNNRPSFYVLSPKAFDDLLEYIWELKVTPAVLSAEAEPRHRVDIEQILAGKEYSDSARDQDSVA